MRHLLSLAFASAVLAAVLSMPSTAHAKTRVLTNCFWPPQHYMCTKVLPTWGKWVEEATEGRVTIQIPPKSLASPPEQWGSVEKGIADAAVQFNGFVANRVTGPLVAMNPFVASADAPAMSEALWETYQKYFADEYKGVHPISMWVITPAGLEDFFETIGRPRTVGQTPPEPFERPNDVVAIERSMGMNDT